MEVALDLHALPLDFHTFDRVVGGARVGAHVVDGVPVDVERVAGGAGLRRVSGGVTAAQGTSRCLARLLVAVALQLSDPTWAVTTAAIVCTPVLGASLRKAFFRMIGTVIGAIGIVILAALFRQDRIGFLVGLALWCAVSAFVATLLRNFAAYAAALSGYTAAILASDVLGPVGTTGGDVTFLAINRAIEICMGILCSGVILALTDIGRSRRKLAAELASLSTAIMDGFADCFLTASSDLTQFQGLRRDLLRRVVALGSRVGCV